MERKVRFGFVLSPVERRVLASLADEDGVSQAAVVRSLIRTEAVRRGFWSLPRRNDRRENVHDD